MIDFTEQVYAAVRRIPPGRVLTYADVARILQRPKAVRAVGNALHKNPELIVMPCHRVVRSDGGLGGYAGGMVQKTALLAKEGVPVENGKVDLTKYLWSQR